MSQLFYFTCVIFCVLLVFGQSILAADFELEIEGQYEYQTMNIHPGSVTGIGWDGLENALVQEVNEDALVSSFNRGNSSRAIQIDVLESKVSSTNIETMPNGSEDQSALGSESGVAEGGSTSGSESVEPTTELIPESASESTPEPEQTQEQISEPEPTATEGGSALQSLSKSFFKFTLRATQLFPFAQVSLVTPLSDPLTDTTVEPIVIENSTESAPVTEVQPIEKPVPVIEPVLESSPIDGSAVIEPASEIQPSDTTITEPVVESTPLSCEGCVKHVIEFSDFAVVGDDDQHISNMQLRVSLGALPHPQNRDPYGKIHIEYLHYDYWIDGGEIVIDDEISNAMNGGYFLFAFPLYSEWDEMKRIKVRLTYESDNEHLADIFLDSVWLEVESIHNNALIDPESMPRAEGLPKTYEEPLRTGVPDEYTVEDTSEKSEFTHDELPHFDFDLKRKERAQGFLERVGNRVRSFFGFEETGKPEGPMRLRIANGEFRGIAKIHENEDGSFELDIPKKRQFKPGRHVVTVEVTDGDTVFYIDKEFTWGVLALNADKSIYLPEEEAHLQMGVLDDLGHTICDAKLDLEIINPAGNIQYLSTDNSTINFGSECAGDTYTTSPDYDAKYTFEDGVGTYAMKLTAVTENGTHTITDSVEVRDAVPFDIVRTGPTRIYPPELYPVTLTITAHEDYSGQIVELVPVSFQVYERENLPFRTHEVGDVKQLIWNVNIQAGETIELSYRFDAPDISPEFYLLGPLTIGSFSEIREWQIASDAPSNAVVVQSIMGTQVSASSYSATLGSAPTNGNTIIMVAMHRDGANAFNAPASYLTQAVLSNATVEEDIGIWYAPANSASTTYTITKTGGNQTGVVFLMEVSGLDTTNLLNVTSSNDQTGTTGLVSFTGLTGTSTPHGFAVAASGFGDNDFTNPTSASWTSSSSAAYTQQSQLQWATGNDGLLAVATANIISAQRQGARLALTTGGVEDRNSVVAVFRLRPQVNTVSARGNQTSEMKINTVNNYVGGAFTMVSDNGTTSVTSITISEAGTTDASVDLSGIRLYYETDTIAPYDCASATYNGTETQYGATSTSFSSANGTSTFSGAVTIGTTTALCVYTMLNVDSSATAGHTLELQITDPSTQVLTGTGSSSPGTTVSISDTTSFVIGYVPNRPTLTPTPSFEHMQSTTTQPTLGGFTATDPDGDVLQYELIIDDDYNLASPATTKYSFNYPTDAGWSSTTFVGGATTTYTIQPGDALTVGTTYWWAVRARDPFNRNEWSATSTPRAITISDALTVPEWFQTTDMQFATTATIVNGTTTGNDSVEIDDLDQSIELLNAWSLGTTKTISSGTDRVLVVAIYDEDNAIANVSSATYGGQTLIEIYDQTVGAGTSGSLWVGYLPETRIASSSGTTIAVTWADGTPTAGDVIYSSAVFQNVDQVNPVRGYSPNALTTGASIAPTASSTVYAGDMVFYAVGAGDGRTYTPHTGYTEGTDNATCAGGCSSATAYKSITTDGTELPTATLSSSANRVAMTLVVLKARARATIMSPEVDFDWVSNQNDWGEVSWSVTEPAESNTRLQVFYGTSTACSAIVPNSALPGNSVGFGATSSPLNISALSTSTSLYNKICLKMTLREGSGTTSPTLNDWNISWERQPVFNQSVYRWYANTASATPTDTWPVGATGSELLENEAINALYPTKTGDVLRLRMGVTVSSVSANTNSFALQYAEGSTCSADMGWTDVAPIGSTTALWRGYHNAGLTDGDTLASSTLTGTDALESYEEENNSASLPDSIAVGEQGEWDWVLENGADSGTSYCFRMVGSDGTPFATYTQYPALVTNNSPAILSVDAPFDNEKVASTSPWFEFLGSDPEGDLLDYQIQIDNTADFSSTIIETDSASNLDDFLNIDTPADKTQFNNEQQIRYTIPSTLANGTTYWWRVRPIDTSGSNIYGEWSTPRSFTRDNGVTVTTWFQTTEAQFDTDLLEGTDATGSDLVTFISGSTTGTTTSSTIHFDDVTIGNAWGELSWTDTEPPGDILYRLEYYDGVSWVLIPDSALTGNAAGFDVSPISLIDLDTETYNQIRIRSNFTNPGGTPVLSDWTVSWGERVDVVTHLLLFDNEKTGTTTPTFTFYTTDPEGDALEYQLSYSTDNTFATGSTTVNSSSSPGFLDVTNNLDLNPYDSGDTIQYKVQSALTNGTTYWWRVRAKDSEAGNSYSFWSDPWSFTIDTNATTSTWFQTTEEQFQTDTLVSLVASSTANSVSTIPAGVTTYNFVGVTSPSLTHVARYFEVDVTDPTDPPAVDEINTITNSGLPAGTPNLRSAIAGYAGDVQATNAQYTQISTSNNTRWTTTDPGTGDNDNAVFWTSFLINEDATDISEIAVTIEGYQAAATDKAWLGIWRPGSTTPYWQRLADSMQTADFNYTGSITSNISQYLDGSNRVHVIFFNEDKGDSLVVDYAQVVVTSNTADSGSITGTSVDFNDGSGPAWGRMEWVDSEPGSSVLSYQLEYLNGVGVWELIPDSALSSNSTGYTTSPIDLRFLDTTTYNEIRPVGNATCSGPNCPTLSDWTIRWSPGFTITGTALEYNGTASTTSGTVAVAVNGVLQTGKTGTIQADGTWSIANVTFFEDDVVTVFVSGANDVDEAVAVTVYDGSPDMSGLRLQKRHLTIGSDDYGIVSNTSLGLYDFTDDEDLFFDVSVGNDLTMCADVSCGDASVRILPYNAYTPGTGADVTTHDLRIDGTFTSGANTVRVSGSWDNNATSTLTGSTVIFNATSTSETVDSTGALASTFNNVTFGEGSGTATWTLGSALDIDGNLAVTYGTLTRGVLDIAVAGDLTTGANGFWTGIGTTTFDGINPGTWTDSNATKQNIGRVLVDGTSKTVLLGSSVTMQSMAIGANDTFDLSISGHAASVYRDWINNGTFTHRTGTVHFIATTTNRIITAGGDAFYNINFNGAGGAWSFTEADLSVTNDFTIATGTVTMSTGTTTVAGSFTNSGGVFAHNNALIYFTSSGAETLTLAGTAFENAFYNVRFTGSGSWTFTEANATTSNNFTITQGTVTMPTDTLTVGGDFLNTGGTFAHNSGTIKFTSATPKTIDTNASFYNLLFTGSGSWSFIDTNVTALNNLTTGGGTLTLPSGTLTLGGSLTNTATLSHNTGTVLFSATTTGKVIATGASSLYNATFNSATGGWTILSSATTTNNVTLTALSAFTLTSGQTLSVGGTFTNSVGGASTTWTGSTLSLEAGAYTVNAKTDSGELYGTLRIRTNTDVKMWNSSSTVYDVDATGSLYSQDHGGVDGDLYIFGAYERTSGNEYWSYATDFDGTALGGGSRQVDVRFAGGASASFTGATLQILGTSVATTTLDIQSGGLYGVVLYNSVLNAEYYDIRHQNINGLQLLDGTLITSLEHGHFTLDAVGGSLVTVSSSTIDANPTLQIYAVTFDTSIGTSSNLTTGDGDETFLFFDDFNDSSIDTGKWTKDIELGAITETGGYLRAGGGIASGNYGHVSLGSEVGYADFLDNSVIWRARNSANGIGELAFRGDYGTSRGYKARFDARVGANGQGFLEPPYAGWAFSGGAGCGSDSDEPVADQWYTYEVTASSTNFMMYRDRALKRNCTDNSFALAGEIALQNHYGSYTDYDWVGVRPFVTPAPTSTSWGAEETVHPGLFRESHVVTGSTVGAQVGYVLPITINYATATDSGETMYCNGLCNTDFSDVRFTDEDGNVLSYWRDESYVVSSTATFWVKFDSIPASPATTSIYVYYGDVAGYNVTQTDGAPTSYWWFRESSGNIVGESFDNDTGDPGSIRWDDSSLTIALSGTVYGDDGITPMGSAVCDDSTQVIRVVVNGGASYTGACSSADGTYSIPGVVVVGDPTLTIYLDTNGGAEGTVITRTPTADITDLDIYQNRVITRHEDTSPMTILKMAVYDNDNDSDIRFTAATGTLTVLSGSELHIASTTTFAPVGDITIQANASGTTSDGSLHLARNAQLTGYATSTYTIGGSFTVDEGAVFTSASTSVIMNATTTGKTITTTASQEITFYNLEFNGVGGGWNINGDIRALQDIDVTNGTVSGTADIAVVGGSLSGNGTLSMGSGTTTIYGTNNLGGTTPWTFANLVLGNGSIVGTTTPASTATTTILGKLTISTAHYLDAGSSFWNLAGIGNVFTESGTLLEDTSTFRYSGTGATNILSTTYYNLDLKAQGGSPTYTPTGLGIIVSGDLTVGGATTTTVTFDTSDPALDVNGSVIIGGVGTLIGSNSAVFTVAGSWNNDGVYTGSGGTVTFDSAGTKTISAGASSFSNVVVNGAGTFTVLEHATTTGTLTLTNATSFTVASGQVLAVGGTFTNSQGGGVTDWTGSVLSLYGGGNYTINSSSTSDTYETLRIASDTQIRMWNSNASSYDVQTSGSLYSQDHANIGGDLYIFGAYTKSTGTDYWSYATDFDGTLLGSPRNVDVYVASGGSILYTGGGLSVIGAGSATTTIQNQGSGTYSFRIGGTASTTMSYYQVRNTDVSGLTFSGTPTVVGLSNGSYEVSQNNGSAITVGGTAIQVKTFTNNRFETSGASPAYNVTATGTTLSSWKFTNHDGSIAGEAYDVDPGANGGDPGYIVWDNSSTSISVSGTVYSGEGAGVSNACDGTNTLRLVVDGVTSYTTSCDGDGAGGGTGAYTFSGVSFNIGDSFIVYIDGQPENAATVSEDTPSTITDFDLYENRVIVRHEGTDPLSIVDMSFWDSSDDADIQFTAVDGTPDTLTLPANRKLIVWSGKEFEPSGNVTISGGGGGSSYDGTLELYSSALFDATGSETHTIGGSLITGSGASIDDETSTFTFTTTGSARTVDTNEYSLHNVVFNGSGSWTVTNTALDVGNDLTITQGAVTFPSGTTTITGSLSVTAGSFNANGGHILFNSAGAETITASTSAFSTLTINGSGSFTLQGAHATATGRVRIENGTLTSVSGIFTAGESFINDGTFIHNSGTLRMTSAGTAVLTASSSDLGNVIFGGGGSCAFTDEDVALVGSLTIHSGSITMASGTMSIGGSFINSGGTFDHATGTILFNSSDVGETVNPGASTFNTVSFASASGGWTITGDATTTGNFSLTSASNFTVSSSTRVAVQGIFTNLVGGGATTWTGSTLAIDSGVAYTINTKVSGGDTYNRVLVSSSTALRAWDSAGSITVLDTNSSFYSQDHGGVSGSLYIFGNYVRASGGDYWSYATDFDGVALGGSSRQVFVYMAHGATTTFTGGSLDIIGTASFDTTINNQGSGIYGMNISGGTLNAQYYSFANMGLGGLTLSGTTTIISLIEGNFTLAQNGGSLITLSSTTLNHNAGLVITGVSFATTSAITGFNVNLVGTTPSAWTFVSHTGNLSGEAYDNDGGDDCGSLRWSNSTCLLTQQSGYRWRNDDGGEGVPNSEWFDVDWGKRKRVTVTNLDPVTYTDAVVMLTIPYATGGMQIDFDDLRFTADDGVTAIEHFTETYTASTEATVWVKVPVLATSTSAEIYMYYGNGVVSDGSATTTFIAIDNYEDGNISEYSGDTGEFVVAGASAYERTYRLEASDPTNGKTDFGGMYNNAMTVSQGETLRFLKYIDTTTGAGDEVCTLFGTQSQTQNYAVCLELFGIDRMSLVQDALHRDTSGTVLATTTVSYSTGWYEVEVDWDTDNSIFVTLSQNDVVVATTSAIDSTYTGGGIGYTLWGYHGGWDMYTSRPLLTTEPTVTIGGEQVSGGASWLASLNSPATGVDIGDNIRARFLIENTGLTVADQNYEIEFAPKGVSPSCESVNYASYVEVPNIASCGTSDICMVSSSQFTNLASTTDVLGGVGTFTYGQIVEDASNNTGNITLDDNEYTELEYIISPTANVTDSNYCFRVSNEGTDLDSYAQVAELGLRFVPNITTITFNSGRDISLFPGATTTVYATGTVTDLNGYADISAATTTMFRSGVTQLCAVDPNNCYRAGPSQCTFENCFGDSCDISCSADFYYHADPTDIGTYAGESWGAELEVADQSGSVATQTAPYIELITLRAISVDSSIDYGALAVNSNTESYNATTTLENIGNDSLDISIEGTDLTDGASSAIPVAQQRFATSTFSYSACVYCSSLSTTSTNYKIDLAKPVSTTPSVTDDLFWGIAIPFGVAGTPHSGTNIFYAIGDI